MQELVAWSANRNKASGFLLIKMQPVVRIIQWFSLLIWMVSSWFYMSRFTGWIGVPFVLSIVAVAIFILTLVGTLWLSPRIEKLEVTTREATIPVALRKRWFVYSLITLVLYAGMYAMMAILATRTVGL